MIDIIAQIKTVDLILKGLRGDLRHLTVYEFQPEKKKYPAGAVSQPLPRSTPEDQGVSSEYLERFFHELDQCRTIQVHSVVALRHGRVIAQAHWKPYTGVYAHMMYSLSKSVTAMAVGIAIEEGLFALDDRLVELFPEKVLPIRSPKLNNITVRHLLNMTSGVRFNEVGTLTERDWVRAYLQSDCSFEPGTEFAYNSMNSYILSALICKKTGMGLVEYLTPRLFQPLGITNVSWEKGPLGIEKGGWGLYLRPEEMAKLGQLYLQKGRWNVNGRERQLIPAHWVEESTRIDVKTSMGVHNTGYGYHLWSFPIEGAYQFNGVFGQYVVVIPSTDMVLAITSGSQNLFIDDSAEIISKYFGANTALKDVSLPQNIHALRSLRKTLESLSLFPETVPLCEKRGLLDRLWNRLGKKKTLPELPAFLKDLDGKTYLLENNEYGTLLPFILSAERNNFSGGISGVSFYFKPETCTLVFVTPEGEQNKIEAGLDGVPRRGDVSVNGEIYTIGATARLTSDEDDHAVLKLFVSFIETPNTRILKFIFDSNRVLVRFDETPSVSAAGSLLLSLVGGNGNNLEKMLAESIDQQKLMAHIRRMIEPKARGKQQE